MQLSLSPMFRSLRPAWVAVATLAATAAVFHAQAQVIPLADQNSTALIDFGSPAGMFNWSVQGQNQLAQQWFWYQVVGGNNQGGALNTLGPAVLSPFNGTRGVTATYGAPGLAIRVDYLLTGGPNVAPGQKASSDMSETITIYNNSANVLNLNFFQYSDFMLGGAFNDTVRLGQNLDGFWNEAQVRQTGGADLTETVVTPGADHGEAALYGSTLAKLNSITAATHLNDVASELTPGNATWAFEWDLSIAPGGYTTISKDKNLTVVVPEPSALALMALGLGGAALIRRRQS